MAKSKLTGDEIKPEEPKAVDAAPAASAPAVTVDLKADVKPPEPTPSPDVAEPAKELAKYEVHMNEMGIHVVPTIVEASDPHDAVEKFFKLTGVIETPHKPTVRKL